MQIAAAEAREAETGKGLNEYYIPVIFKILLILIINFFQGPAHQAAQGWFIGSSLPARLNYYNKLCFYLAAQQFDEGANPGRMSRPGRGQVGKFSVHNSVVGAIGKSSTRRPRQPLPLPAGLRDRRSFFALDRHRRPTRICGPWQMAATGFAGSEKTCA